MKKLLSAFLALALTVPVSAEMFYERSVNNLGRVTISQTNVPIGRMADMLFPKEWFVSYMSDEMRNLVVSWDKQVNGKQQNWHDALRQIGINEQLVFLLDGAERQVYVTYPGYGRNPGVEIINSTSIVFQEDRVTQEIINRSKANEMNYRRRQIEEERGRAYAQESQLKAQLDKLAEEQLRVERQLEKLSLATTKVVQVTESARREREKIEAATLTAANTQKPSLGTVADASATDMAATVAATNTKAAASTPSVRKADFVFYVRQGLVINDNARRFARELGYDVLVVDKKVPANCDWEQEIEFTITDKDPRASFTKYVAKYGFRPNFAGGIAELVYTGSTEQFAGCA